MVFPHKTLANETLQKHFLELVSSEVHFNRYYLIALVLATIIATLGLLLNSAAVVIGAMLIAPLFWPILGVATGTVTTREHALGRSFRLLIVSILLVLLTSYLITLLSPLSAITPEIQARLNPTIIDLLIALASSIVAIIALYWPQLSGSMAGVAVAVSLLPPLCVTGIGLAFGDTEMSGRSLLLFGANLASIIFTGIVLLYALGFRPRRAAERRTWVMGVILSAMILIAIAFPLALFLEQSLEENKLRNSISSKLTAELATLQPEAKLNNILIHFTPKGSQPISVEADVLLSEGAYIDLGQKNRLTSALASLTSRPINLELSIVRSLSIRQDEDAAIAALNTKIETYLSRTLSALDENLIIESIAIQHPSEQDGAININLLLRQPDNSKFDYAEKQTLASSLSASVGVPITLEIELIPIIRVEAESDATIQKKTIEQVLVTSLMNIADSIALDTLNIATDNSTGVLTVEATIRIPEEVILTFNQKEAIRAKLKTAIDQPVVLEIYLLPFFRVTEPLPQPDAEVRLPEAAAVTP